MEDICFNCVWGAESVKLACVVARGAVNARARNACVGAGGHDAANGSILRHASSLKRSLQGCRGFATTGGPAHVNSLRWRSLVCFVEGVGQAILGALACGYRCAARAAPIDVLQLKRELQGCRGFATTGGPDHVDSLRWRSLMFPWRLGAEYISWWNETWG